MLPIYNRFVGKRKALWIVEKNMVLTGNKRVNMKKQSYSITYFLLLVELNEINNYFVILN